MTFPGQVSPAGKLELHNREGLERHIASLAGKRVEVLVREPKKQRTLKANAYYWFVVTLIANEIGETVPDRVHDGLRHKYLVRSDEGGIPKVASTTELSTKEFADYVNRILTDAATGDLIGSPLWIPKPGEGDAPEW